MQRSTEECSLLLRVPMMHTGPYMVMLLIMRMPFLKVGQDDITRDLGKMLVCCVVVDLEPCWRGRFTIAFLAIAWSFPYRILKASD